MSEPTERTILDALRRHGPFRLKNLADFAAEACLISDEEAAACVGDLMQRGEVTYGADGSVSLVRNPVTRAMAYSVVEVGGGWSWTLVGGDDAAREATARDEGIGGWLLLDGKVIGDYRRDLEAAESRSGVPEGQRDQRDGSVPVRRSKGDCAGSEAGPEAAGDAPGPDGGAEGAETGQDDPIGTYNPTIEVALRRCLNRRTSGPYVDSAVADLVPVVRQLVDQAVAANAEEIAVALEAISASQFAASAGRNIDPERRAMHNHHGFAFDAAADIAREHGKARP